MFVGSNPAAVTYTSDIALVTSKEFLDIHATTWCRFTVKCVGDMIIAYSLVLFSMSYVIFCWASPFHYLVLIVIEGPVAFALWYFRN